MSDGILTLLGQHEDLHAALTVAASMRGWSSRPVSLDLAGDVERLLAALGIDGELPAPAAGPLRIGGSGMEVSTQRFYCCVEPVALRVELDNIRLRRVSRAQRHDAMTLCESIFRPILATAGWEIVGNDPSQLALAREDHWSFSARSPAALDGMLLRDEMPQGPQGGRLRALQMELQMALHSSAPMSGCEVNGLWFWGGGGRAALPPLDLPVLRSSDLVFRGLWGLSGNSNSVSDEDLRVVGASSAPGVTDLRDLPPGDDREGWFTAVLQQRDAGIVRIVPPAGPLYELRRRRFWWPVRGRKR